MGRSVTCVEPDGRPERARLELGENPYFAVFLVAPDGALRRTVLRASADDAPIDGRLLLSLAVRGEAGAATLVVTRTSPDLVVRAEQANVERGFAERDEVPTGPPLTVRVDDRDVRFALEFDEDARRGAHHAASDATVGSGGLDSTAPVYWMVPTVWETASAPLGRLLSEVRVRLQRAGVPPMLLSVVLLGLVALGGVLWAAWQERQARTAAEETVAVVSKERDQALAAADGALAGERACATERVKLAEDLGDAMAALRARAESALDLPASRVRARARLGAMHESDADDAAQSAALIAAVAKDAAGLRTLDDTTRCRAPGASLTGDLAAYILVWHPDPEIACPEAYDVVRDGVHLVGEWGLSDRVAGPGPDQRVQPRWAAQRLAKGVRDTRDGLLSANTGGRPAAAPGLVDFWALVLWDGYNRMAKPAEGADPGEAACARRAVESRTRAQVAARAGEPVLPDPTAPGDWSPAPEVGCPWPADTVKHGVTAAVRAAARTAREAP